MIIVDHKKSDPMSQKHKLPIIESETPADYPSAKRFL